MTDSEVRNADMVEIRHPGHPGVTARITRRAFENRSRKLGWVLAGEAEDPPAEPPAQPGSFVDYQEKAIDEKRRLQQILRDRGVQFDGRAGVKTLKRLIEESE